MNSFDFGVWPVMLTPFNQEGRVDLEGLESLVEWYINQGVSGLFALCQSSEIFELTIDERVEIAKTVVNSSRGRVKVIASGQIANNLEEQILEVNAIADTGVDAVVLLTNRFAKKDESDVIWLENLQMLLDNVSNDIKFGLYECPYPYKRLLSHELLRKCVEMQRFYFLKDTCCDATLIKERLQILKDTGFNLYNANTTTLLQTLKDGCAGYSGVMANFHPELYVWLCNNYNSDNSKTIHNLLTICSLIEKQLYPVNAKYHLSALEQVNILCNSRVKEAGLLTETYKSEIVAMNSICNEMYKNKCI